LLVSNVKEDLKRNLSRKTDEKEKEVLNKSFMSENEAKQIKELQKKVGDLEKSFKVMIKYQYNNPAQ
jgi:hypothetical protein